VAGKNITKAKYKGLNKILPGLHKLLLEENGNVL